MRRYALSRYGQSLHLPKCVFVGSQKCVLPSYTLILKKSPDTNRDAALAYKTAVYSQNFARHVVKPVGKTHNRVRHVVGSAQP